MLHRYRLLLWVLACTSLLLGPIEEFGSYFLAHHTWAAFRDFVAYIGLFLLVYFTGPTDLIITTKNVENHTSDVSD